MAKANDHLGVYLHESFVGQLSLQGRDLTFKYDSQYLKTDGPTLSVRLPLSEQLYGDDIARPFFANLLPEGGFRRELCRQYGISEANDFALLKAIGGDCAGAVSILPDDEVLLGASKRNYHLLEKHDLANLFPQQQNSKMMVAGQRLSLAGAQNKVPLYFDGTDLYIPVNGAPSSHILKPAMGEEYPGSVANELFCNKLADEIGLTVPQTEWFYGHYLIERYDRIDKNGQINRLHQEDFCQALGYLPTQKYQTTEGGPGFKQCFQLLNGSGIPVFDKKRLLEWGLFNLIIGNADAHAKNISILYRGSSYQLAPLYDLICTAVYPGLDNKLAMKIGGENRLQWLSLRHLQRFAEEDADIKVKMVHNELKKMLQNISEAAPSVAQKVFSLTGEKIVAKILEIINKNCEKLSKISSS
ncbi:MAG: type II toxin-antitoxin system HipA family toxin [Magnetococcales bacterium]|nr:type II toxin-antitoxin system HipA family toxin [Magnetococcales bacterium]